MKFAKYLFAGALLIAAGSAAGAAEYFVNKRDTAGDTNDGLSRERAFLTLQWALHRIKPGDTLTVGPGEYFESLRCDKLGSAEKDTVIRAEIPGTVVLRGDIAAPEFRKVEGRRFVYVADFDFAGEVPAVNELDSLKIFECMPNASELEFRPGAFHHDRAAGKLYVSSSDMRPATLHRYSVSVIPTHGVYLTDPRRVVLEGLAVTGFNAMREVNYREGTLGGVWGMFLFNGKECVIRDCRAWLNGWGIALNSGKATSGDNVIERCAAWANNSQFYSGDMGGLSIFQGRRDVIRDSTAFLNGNYGVNIYGTGTDGGTYGDKNVGGNDEKNKSRLINNLAWGNYCDFKIKTGVEYFHTTEHCIGLGMWSLTEIRKDHAIHCLMGRERKTYSQDNIVLSQGERFDLRSEFADPDNYDFRPQATSSFRGAAPDGSDRGPFAYQANIFYVRPDGDDAADGLSVKKAWKTLVRAVKNLRAGDTLYLQPGVYRGTLELNLQGKEGAPVSIRGQGREPVVIQGGLQLQGSRQVEFKRLNFGGEVKVGQGKDIAFEGCQFTAGRTALEATEINGLSVAHCVFTGFKEAAVALKDCSKGDLRGNLYDNRDGAALRLDRAEAVAYSNYNSYRRAGGAWVVGRKNQQLADVQKTSDQQSQELIPEFAREKGTTTLKNPEVFAAGGPMGKPIGFYRDEPVREMLRLTHGPEVHSVSATTVNLEWTTSLPATCELGWGETPACANTVSFDGNYFGSYSLTGLKPGRTYYFQIRKLTIPDEVADRIHAAPAVLEGKAISFTTLKVNAAPATYHVAADGDDERSGMGRQNAWKTIGHAAEKVNAGDTVLISGGTYSERVRIRATGETGAPITFKCLPGEKVTLSGAGKALNSAFVVAGKSHLRFDGLHFRDFGLFPHQGWRLAQGAEFHLYHGRDIQITRCFSDGLGGYTARSIVAWHVEDLLVKNCINTNKMDGAMLLERCPNLRIENCVFARPMIRSFVLRNDANEKATMDNNIFTDMFKKKADLNIGLLAVDRKLDAFQLKNGCFFLRSFPPQKRALLGEGDTGSTAMQLEKYIISPFFADPQFAGAVALLKEGGKPDEFSVELLMDPDLKTDFDSFFATNPEVVRRGIGLQPEAFQDFRFNRPAVVKK